LRVVFRRAKNRHDIGGALGDEQFARPGEAEAERRRIVLRKID
jgi:hypothetical protein